MSNFRYNLKTLDGPRTSTKQLMLLRDAAHTAWHRWQHAEFSSDGAKPETKAKYKEQFADAMRQLYTTLRETEIFLSGMNESAERGPS